MQARVSFKRIESFLSRSADDVRNEEVYGKAGSDRHCPDLAKGQLKIEDGETRVTCFAVVSSSYYTVSCIMKGSSVR